MSIRARLTIALGLLLLATIIAMISALLFDARHRVETEVSSSVQTAATLLESSLAAIEHDPNHDARVRQLMSRLQDLRHFRLYLQSEGRDSAQQKTSGSADALASLFAVDPGEPVRLDVRTNGRVIDTLVIEPARNDEFLEVLETIRRLAFYAVGLAAAAFTITTWLINRSLAPVHALDAAMHEMEAGNYDVGVPQNGPPEIARICSQLNTLAQTLQRSRAENQRLSTEMVRIQDEERRDIARDLHDELGPFLFAFRATGTALNTQIAAETIDRPRIQILTGDMNSHVQSLQETNRRVLHQLSPVGLTELGLSNALLSNVGLWRRQPDMCTITLETADGIDALDTTIATTIYRVVQEGLTNAVRHADASLVAITVQFADCVPAQSGAPRSIVVTVLDDGEGVADEIQPGFGLKGMRERVIALGGTLRVEREGNRGTRVEARIPLVVSDSSDNQHWEYFSP